MIERLETFPREISIDAVTLRIKALYNTYCESVGVDLFVQKSNGEVTAVFGGMDGSFSLVCFENADYDELNSYFGFLGAAVFCYGSVAERLKPLRSLTSELYEFIGQAPDVEGDGHGGILSVYDILKKGEDGDISLPPRDLWYTDFCLRFNHSAAEYFVKDNAVAAAGFMTEEASLITGVAVDKSVRKNGLGSEALRGVLANIRRRFPSSRVFAATQNAAGFYIKNGFEYGGIVAVCEYRE